MGGATRFAWSEPDWIGVTLGSFPVGHVGCRSVACMERLSANYIHGHLLVRCDAVVTQL